MSAAIDIGELRARSAGGPAGGRPASATLTLGPDWSGLPAVTELAALLSRVPVSEVRLTAPVDFSTLPGHVISRAVALIRECSSIGARVTWSLALSPERLDVVRQLDHLPAPAGIAVHGRGGGAGRVREWRSSAAFGLFYFRRGPGFLSVLDRRSGPTDRTVLVDRTAIEVFSRGLAGCAWDEVTQDSAHAAAVRELVDRGLVLRVGDHCVTLPIHMRSWPIGTVLLGGTLASAGSKDAPERL
ncbi:hypothetical protein JOF41_000929 [Saccharothrix coeruleofusca]|uniref:DUF5825 family protein n=1 Tax=Saccharothrix coeruleofusca TaxID=33919 RepID=UPI001AE357FE|nr:DUF5825 family protein [Saccharothrix coeruleofusca]MBP2334751.1 hypothetical protein [Saccharothrix coeruleofusca]